MREMRNRNKTMCWLYANSAALVSRPSPSTRTAIRRSFGVDPRPMTLMAGRLCHLDMSFQGQSSGMIGTGTVSVVLAI